MGFPLRRWNVAPARPVDLGDPGKLPAIIIQILYNRGISEPSEIDAFLRGNMTHSSDPFVMRDMKAAVDRVALARLRGERVAIYGDYDADGITALALLYETLLEVGLEPLTYIPNRKEEGYGLNCQALEHLKGQGVDLVISVDCGVSSIREVARAREIGLDVVVTDHHQVPAELPRAVAVVDPHRADCAYPFKDLAGVGVAFRFAQALLQVVPPDRGRSVQDFEQSVLDLVALGTVADVAPLLGENRSMVVRGLEALNRAQRPGLRELISVAGMRPGEITTASISYGLAPRINATGRLHDASVSLDLLLTHDPVRAGDLARELDGANQQRQKLTAEAMDSARKDLMSRDETPSLLLVKGAAYPVGIVGLVASRLVEEFYRPALVVTLGDGQSRGSARSIEELDIMEALGQCEDLLAGYGGHARAAGFTVSNNKLDELERKLQHVAACAYGGKAPEARIAVDCRLEPSDLTWDLQRWMLKLEPYGFGNPEPLFQIWKLRLVECRAVGREQPTHLRLRLDDGKRTWNGIWFGMGGEVETVRRMVHVEVLAHLHVNEWRGTSSLELQIKDLKPG